MIQIDMEMPKMCGWYDSNYHLQKCPILDIYGRCKLQDYKEYQTWENQYVHCPLHEVKTDSDTISRKQANEALKYDAAVLGIEPFDSGYTPFDAILTLHALSPSPSRPKGHWIPCTKNGLPLSEMAYREGQKWYGYKCSNCNFIYKGNALTESPYCKKCGADMRGGAV